MHAHQAAELPTYRVKSVKATLAALQELNHATAQEVYEWVNQHSAKQKISLTSIYRALNTLVADARVKPLHFNDGQVRYELNHPDEHHHHFVCLRCNRIQVIDACPIDAVVEQFRQQFQIDYHHFELFGACAQCRSLVTGDET